VEAAVADEATSSPGTTGGRHEYDLIDRFVAHVAPAVEGPDLTERTLDVLLSLSGARGVALYVPQSGSLHRIAVRGEVDPLDGLVGDAWQRHQMTFLRGLPYFTPDPGRSGGCAIVPILDGDHVQALVCVSGAPTASSHAGSIERLLRGVPVLGRILFGEPGGARIPAFDAAAGIELAKSLA
jgi:hypothetical protein